MSTSFSEADIREVEEFANQIRRLSLDMTKDAGASYLGQAFEMADLTAALYVKYLNLNPDDAEDPNRDRFLLSTGHYAIGVYAAMALIGQLPMQSLGYYAADGSPLEQIGAERKPSGLEIGGGSLAMGLGRAVGFALAARIDNADWNTVCYTSDGELQEGSTWEAAHIAANFGLDNLVVIVDANGMQVDGDITAISSMRADVERWEAFGWNAREIDGHNVSEILDALYSVQKNGKPSIIIAHTVIAKGISTHEGTGQAHFVTLRPGQYEEMVTELEGQN